MAGQAIGSESVPELMDETRQRIRVVATGHVQGVWYRGSMQDEARRLGITGWVRNRADGSVEAEASGAAAALDRLVAWARVGPRAARVEEVRVEALPDAAADSDDFTIRR